MKTKLQMTCAYRMSTLLNQITPTMKSAGLTAAHNFNASVRGTLLNAVRNELVVVEANIRLRKQDVFKYRQKSDPDTEDGRAYYTIFKSNRNKLASLTRKRKKLQTTLLVIKNI